ANESALDVAVYAPGRLQGRGARNHRPGAGLFLAGREKRDQSEQLHELTEQTLRTTLFDAQLAPELSCVSGGKFCEFSLELGAESCGDSARPGVAFLQTNLAGGGLRGVRLPQVEDDEHRLQ